MGILCSLNVILVTRDCGGVVQVVTAGDDVGMVIFCCANEQEQHPLTCVHETKQQVKMNMLATTLIHSCSHVHTIISLLQQNPND